MLKYLEFGPTVAVDATLPADGKYKDDDVTFLVHSHSLSFFVLSGVKRYGWKNNNMSQNFTSYVIRLVCRSVAGK